MITKRVVEKAKKPIKWQSRLFTVPKKDTDKLRIILDLSHLNKFIQCPTFKMLTLREVKMLLPQHHFTASLDLKDGYWHVPITPKKRPYLGFEYKNTTYQFRAMPFGLNIAPRIFTKLIAHVSKLVAEKNIFMLAYLDDLLIVSPSFHQCQQHLQTVIEILQSLGWIINEKSSRTEPQQVFQWLGLQWD